MISTFITGIRFRGQAATNAVNMTGENFEYILQPEPTNKYDENAIMVLCLMEGENPLSLDVAKERFAGEENFVQALSNAGIEALQVGYIPKIRTFEIHEAWAKGNTVRAVNMFPGQPELLVHGAGED